LTVYISGEEGGTAWGEYIVLVEEWPGSACDAD
jgi:hypothetical protein